jgi:hypothetical protein
MHWMAQSNGQESKRTWRRVAYARIIPLDSDMQCIVLKRTVLSGGVSYNFFRNNGRTIFSMENAYDRPTDRTHLSVVLSSVQWACNT